MFTCTVLTAPDGASSPHSAVATCSAVTGRFALSTSSASTARGLAPGTATARPAACTSSGPRIRNSTVLYAHAIRLSAGCNRLATGLGEGFAHHDDANRHLTPPPAPRAGPAVAPLRGRRASSRRAAQPPGPLMAGGLVAPHGRARGRALRRLRRRRQGLEKDARRATRSPPRAIGPSWGWWAAGRSWSPA